MTAKTFVPSIMPKAAGLAICIAALGLVSACVPAYCGRYDCGRDGHYHYHHDRDDYHHRDYDGHGYHDGDRHGDCDSDDDGCR